MTPKNTRARENPSAWEKTGVLVQGLKEMSDVKIDAK